MTPISEDIARREKTAANLAVRLSLALALLLVIAAYLVSHATDPLYHGNQNTYFTHGLAAAGVGFLSEDFFARSTNPYPLFRALVTWTHAILGEGWFHVYMAALKAVFLVSLIGLSSRFSGTRFLGLESLLTATVYIWASSATVWFSTRIAGIGVAQYINSGLANQGIPGHSLQPSSFGVLLVLAMWLRVSGRRGYAVAIAAAVWFHPSYMLAAACLVVALAWLDLRASSNPFAALKTPVLVLLLVVPVIAWGALHFAPTTVETWTSATDYLALRRLPHHAQLLATLNLAAYVKMGTLVLAALATRERPESALLWMPAALGALLSAVQIVTGNSGFALLFPWRISVVLVPVCTCILIQLGFAKLLAHRPFTHISSRVLSVLMAAGILGWTSLHGARLLERRFAECGDRPMCSFMAYVRDHARPDDLYLIPTNLENFRLATGARTFVDKKSHPLKDVEVLEWRDRLNRANGVYGAPDRCAALDELRTEYPLTHVVGSDDDRRFDCSFLVERYRNPPFSLYEIST